MRRFFITIEYDGTDLVGWQRQDNGPSVQAFIEDAAKALTGQPILVQGSGRTDSGVHAMGQVAHLDMPDKFDSRSVALGLNAKLQSKQVKIVKAEEVKQDAHARFSALRRHYIYRILNKPIGSSLHRDFVWHVRYHLDVDAMQEGANHLIGTHDFTSFRATACQAASPVRSLDVLTIKKHEDEIHIHASALSFLHHQIRNITGTLVQVGRGKWHPDDVKKALEACDRSAAGPKAPAHGLYFRQVDFPDDCYLPGDS